MLLFGTAWVFVCLCVCECTKTINIKCTNTHTNRQSTCVCVCVCECGGKLKAYQFQCLAPHALCWICCCFICVPFLQPLSHSLLSPHYPSLCFLLPFLCHLTRSFACHNQSMRRVLVCQRQQGGKGGMRESGEEREREEGRGNFAVKATDKSSVRLPFTVR